jgi:Acetyltransferase (GNAT) domain
MSRGKPEAMAGGCCQLSRFGNFPRCSRHSPDDTPSEHHDAPLTTLTMRIVGKPRDREIIPRGCSGFATIGPANLSFFRHQGAGRLSFAFEHGTVEFLGVAGFHRIGSPEPEVGIWINETAHGLGYGRETIGAIVKWASAHIGAEAFIYPVVKLSAMGIWVVPPGC